MNTATPTGLNALKYKTIDGLRIRYATNDKTSGDPILMLSPLPESILAFLPIWDTISELGPVIAVDLPPFGRSEVRKEARTPEAVGAFVLTIMEAFDLKRPHVIAPDIGTPACLLASASHPGVFKSLVIGSGATNHRDILGSLDDSRDFAEIVMDLWIAGRESGNVAGEFDALARQLLTAKKRHVQVQELEEALFASDFEV